MTVPKYVDFKCFQIKNNIRSLRLTGINAKKLMFPLTLSWRRPLTYRNQSSANQWTGFYMITASVMKELKITEAVAQRCSVEKVFPEISQISQENTCPKISFLIKLQGLRLHLHYMNFEKFLRAPFIAGHLRWLFLKSLHLSFLKGAVTDMRYFARSKSSMILGHKKNFSLIWQVVFKLGYVFCQER